MCVNGHCWQKKEKSHNVFALCRPRKPEQKMRGDTAPCAQLLGELRRMINCRRRTHPRRFIAYQDENGWLDVRANAHAIIGCNDTAVVNGA